MLRTVIFLLVFSFSFQAWSKSDRSVVTVSPISHTLTQAMLQNTAVEVAYLPPKRLPLSRIPSWINKNQTKKYPAYDAFVSISKIQPELDYFLSLRQTNIRIVAIDIAYALLPKGERVALTHPNEFFWLNSNNTLLMLGILKRDLSALWPDLKPVIEKNYRRISAEVRKSNLEIEALLRQHDIAAITVDNIQLSSIVASLSVDLISKEEANSLVQMDLNAIMISSVYSKNTHNTSHLALVPEWKIDDFSRYRDAPFDQRLRTIVEQLKRLLDDP